MGLTKKVLFEQLFESAIIPVKPGRFKYKSEQRFRKFSILVDAMHLLFVWNNCNQLSDVPFHVFNSIPKMLGNIPITEVNLLLLCFDLGTRPSLERGFVSHNRRGNDGAREEALTKMGSVAAKRVQAILNSKTPQELDSLPWPGLDGYRYLFSCPGFKTRILIPYIRYRCDIDARIKNLLKEWAKTTKIVTRGLQQEFAPDPNGGMNPPPYALRKKTESWGCVEVYQPGGHFMRSIEYDGVVSVGAPESDTMVPSFMINLVRRDHRFDVMMISNDTDMGPNALLTMGWMINSALPETQGQGLYFRVKAFIPAHFADNPELKDNDTYDLRLCYNIVQNKANELMALAAGHDISVASNEFAKRSFTKNFIFLLSMFFMLGGNDYAESLPKIGPEDWLKGLERYMTERGLFTRMSKNLEGTYHHYNVNQKGFMHIIEFDRLMYTATTANIPTIELPVWSEPYINRYRFLHLAGITIKEKFKTFEYIQQLESKSVPDSKRKNPTTLSVSYMLSIVNRAFYSLTYFATQILPEADMPEALTISTDLSGFKRLNSKLEEKDTVDPDFNLTWEPAVWGCGGGGDNNKKRKQDEDEFVIKNKKKKN